MVRMLVLGQLALLWGAVAGAAVLLATKTNTWWNAEVAYLVLAAVVVAAWDATGALLRTMRLEVPYRPN